MVLEFSFKHCQNGVEVQVDTTATSRSSIGRPEMHSPDSPSSPQSPNRTSSTPETNFIAYESRTERLLNMHKRLEVEFLASLNLQPATVLPQ